MATDLERKAKEAFVDDDFELALELYTRAVEVDPKSADLLADRAQTNIKLGNYTEAVADANKAIDLDPSLSKAYLRKATACLRLEEFQTAKIALEKGASMTADDSRFTKLIKECEEHIAEETGGLLKPVLSNGTPTCTSTSLESCASTVANESTKSSEIASELPAQATVITKPKFRHDYYNSTTEIVLTFFAKGIPAENVNVNFGVQTLSVAIIVPGEDDYHFQPRLFGKILPERCRYQVLSSKIEIRLTKAEAITWTSLEYNKEKLALEKAKAPKAERPIYPSSKSKFDWDKLEAQVKKEEKEEKLDGDAALNKMFRDIYQDADEDMRRAMSKSFVESNGTVLSTNWKEVGSKKIESTPPDSMELRKWEY